MLTVRDIATFLQCNPTGEFSLESIKTIFSPVHQSVHQSSPPVQSSDCRLVPYLEPRYFNPD